MYKILFYLKPPTKVYLLYIMQCFLIWKLLVCLILYIINILKLYCSRKNLSFTFVLNLNSESFVLFGQALVFCCYKFINYIWFRILLYIPLLPLIFLVFVLSHRKIAFHRFSLEIPKVYQDGGKALITNYLIGLFVLFFLR